MAFIKVSPGAAGSTAAYVTQPLDSQAYQYFAFASNLQSTDAIAVSVYLPDGNTSVPAPDVQGVTTGLSNTAPVRWYRGGPAYVLTKTGTAGTGDVYQFFNVFAQ